MASFPPDFGLFPAFFEPFLRSERGTSHRERRHLKKRYPERSIYGKELPRFRSKAPIIFLCHCAVRALHIICGLRSIINTAVGRAMPDNGHAVNVKFQHVIYSSAVLKGHGFSRANLATPKRIGALAPGEVRTSTDSMPAAVAGVVRKWKALSSFSITRSLSITNSRETTC
jgi:hypothetical protein